MGNYFLDRHYPLWELNMIPTADIHISLHISCVQAQDAALEEALKQPEAKKKVGVNSSTVHRTKTNVAVIFIVFLPF